MKSRVLLYFHTIKYLKVKQIFWRFVYLFPPLFLTKRSTFPATILIQFKCLPSAGITSDYEKFNFLNEEHLLSDIGWENELISKLWLYNLHYFDFLNQEDDSPETLQLQEKIIDKWIDENPFGKGTGWESYPLSLRIINWIKWHWKTDGLSDKAKLSLWNQIHWLSGRLEYHLLGNHLFINLKALFFASAIFGFENTSSIYSKAEKSLNTELKEQFLPDGAHFELSPMYHALAMMDLQDLFQIRSGLPESFPFKKIENIYVKGMKWLSLMTYKNHDFSNFNDCANGIAPRFSDLFHHGNLIGLKPICVLKKQFRYLKDSGFAILKSDECHLITDIGEIGPSYIPGHSHADSLSFEFALDNKRIIVNSGTSEYGLSKERIRQRGTSAHSTVEVDSANSSEVWSGFRVGRRAKVFNVKYSDDHNILISASHDGYKRLVNKPVHTRTWNLVGKNLDIIDYVSGDSNKVDLRFYLHPNIMVNKSDNTLLLHHESKQIAVIKSNSNMELIKTSFHNEFGSHQNNICVIIKGITPFYSRVSINWEK